MRTSKLKGRVIRSGAALAAASLAVGTLVLGGLPAGADPKQYTALVGTGSDTTQDVLNALAGEANNNNFTPVQSSTASLKRQLVSWDAVGSVCITPKAPGATFLRPNGSTNGRRALSRAIDGGTWPGTTPDCGGPKAVSGLIDFARSSAGPSGAGTTLTYIPFGRDALSFAYYRSSGAPVTSLSSAQLTNLFETGPQTIGGVQIVPCGIQTGSGTFAFWNTALTLTTAEEATGTAVCNAAGNGARLQENDAAGLKAKGDAQPGVQVIVGFSAANFISQSNGFAASQLAAGVDLGAIDALGVPYSGTAPNTSPSATFYASGTFGRDVYNVVATARIGPPAGANADLKSLFVGSASAVCAATSTIQNFGFLSLGASCGSTTLQGPLVAN